MHKVEVPPLSTLSHSNLERGSNKVTEVAIHKLDKLEVLTSRSTRGCCLNSVSQVWTFMVSIFTCSFFRISFPRSDLNPRTRIIEEEETRLLPIQKLKVEQCEKYESGKELSKAETEALKEEVGWYDMAGAPREILERPHNVKKAIVIVGIGQMLCLELIEDMLHGHYFKNNTVFLIRNRAPVKIEATDKQQIDILRTQFLARAIDLRKEEGIKFY